MNFCPSLLLAIEEVAAADAPGFAPEAGLQADGLGAELNLVRPVRLGAAPLVFYRHHPSVGMDLDHIANASQAVGIRPDREAARNAHPRPALAHTGVGFLVQGLALGGGEILRPLTLDMNERTLSRAIEIVLEGGEGDCAG